MLGFQFMKWTVVMGLLLLDPFFDSERTIESLSVAFSVCMGAMGIKVCLPSRARGNFGECAWWRHAV